MAGKEEPASTFPEAHWPGRANAWRNAAAGAGRAPTDEFADLDILSAAAADASAPPAPPRYASGVAVAANAHTGLALRPPYGGWFTPAEPPAGVLPPGHAASSAEAASAPARPRYASSLPANANTGVVLRGPDNAHAPSVWEAHGAYSGRGTAHSAYALGTADVPEGWYTPAGPAPGVLPPGHAASRSSVEAASPRYASSLPANANTGVVFPGADGARAPWGWEAHGAHGGTGTARSAYGGTADIPDGWAARSAYGGTAHSPDAPQSAHAPAPADQYPGWDAHAGPPPAGAAYMHDTTLDTYPYEGLTDTSSESHAPQSAHAPAHAYQYPDLYMHTGPPPASAAPALSAPAETGLARLEDAPGRPLTFDELVMKGFALGPGSRFRLT